jgi:hypothetical protein
MRSFGIVILGRQAWACSRHFKNDLYNICSLGLQKSSVSKPMASGVEVDAA